MRSVEGASHLYNSQNKIDNEHRLGIHMTMKMVYV
jgi:hypothetical protein